ncbi:MAG: helix-turn-helix domain-containing protein [Lentisphaeria bacterium]|nr:helix-turn-helix domain-containing protein [Lentisphaeria bacterium]
MKCHIEKVLPEPDESIAVEHVIGPVADCIYHLHPEYELTYVQSGFGCRYIGNNISNFEPGDLVLIKNNTPHFYHTDLNDANCDDWCKIMVIQFREQHLLPQLPELNDIREMINQAGSGIIFYDIDEESIRKVLSCKKIDRLTAFWQLLDQLSCSRYELISTPESPNHKINQDDRINTVIKTIHKYLEINRPITLAAMAKVANMTPEAFSSYFHKSARKKFIDYLIELKLSRAKNLLLHTNLQIWDIAERSNFSNLSNFNRLFLKHYKMSPREFRKKWKF